METSKQNINNKAKQRKCTHRNKGKFLFCSHKSFMQALFFSDFVLMLISLLKPRLLHSVIIQIVVFPQVGL